MEHIRKNRMMHIRDQENEVKGKTNLLPTKRQELQIRGALGELTNKNLNAQREFNVGKLAVAAAEHEKKVIVRTHSLRSNYNHVQSKIDTGLSIKNTQTLSRPPLRREESTASLAARAAARSKLYGVVTDANSNQNNTKESVNILVQAKKEKKKAKLPTLKEYVNVNKSSKTLIKEPTESLGKLKLVEPSEKEVSIIKKNKVIKNIEKNEADVKSPLDLTQPLPEDIEDIDAKDNDSPLLMSIYIKDIYRYLIELEKKYPIEPDHLKNQVVITGKMRATLIDWLVEVQHQFSLLLETFHLTVGILDRYLQAVPNIQRSQLQLVGVTAMFIACKYEEVYAPEVQDFIYVTDNAYTKADVFRCEIDILTKLGFCLARPIPLSFLRRFVKAANGTSKNHHLAKYFVDLCLVEYSMAHFRPSELSAAAMCLSLYLLSDKKLEDIWTRTLTFYSGYTLQKIQPIIRRIAKIVVNAENSKLKAVYKKYSDPVLARVSSLPQLKGDSIRELAESDNFD